MSEQDTSDQRFSVSMLGLGYMGSALAKAFLAKQPWYREAMARGARAVPAPASLPRATGRYPPPRYPRWDNTQR